MLAISVFLHFRILVHYLILRTCVDRFSLICLLNNHPSFWTDSLENQSVDASRVVKRQYKMFRSERGKKIFRFLVFWNWKIALF